jgi:hypothetical protein
MGDDADGTAELRTVCFIGVVRAVMYKWDTDGKAIGIWKMASLEKDRQKNLHQCLKN